MRGLRFVQAVLLAAVVVTLGIYIWRTTYTRYITDDFCTATALRKRGFVGAMKFHRETWSGRYSYYAAKAIPESIGPITAGYVPGITIVLWCAAAIWAARRFAASESRLFTALLGVVMVFVVIDGTVDALAIGGSVVWETGVVTYMLPLVLYTVWAGLFFGAGRVAARGIAAAALLFVAGGLSETSLAAQGVMAAGVLIAVLLLRRKDLLPIAASGFAATLFSLLLVVTAPGNAIRMQRLPPQPPLDVAIARTFSLGYNYIGSIAFSDGVGIVLIMFCGLLLGAGYGAGQPATAPRRAFDLRAAFLASAIAAAAYGATFLPAAWMLGGTPPPRALHVTSFFWMATILPLAAAAGAWRPRAVRTAAPLLAALSLIVVVHSANVTAESLDQGRKGAAEMERIEAILRAHPRERVVIHSPWAISNRVLVEEPEFWTNRCISDFYGVVALRITR